MTREISVFFLEKPQHTLRSLIMFSLLFPTGANHVYLLNPYTLFHGKHMMHADILRVA